MKDYKKEIAQDLNRLSMEYDALCQAQKLAVHGQDWDDLWLSGTAYHLQLLYTGFEKIAEKNLATEGVKLITDGAYHKNLLNTYFARFAFSAVETKFLEDLRAFRHMARSAYGSELEPELIKSKLEMTVNLWPLVVSTIRAYTGLA